MKLRKLLLAVAMLFGLAACGGKEAEPQIVGKYVIEAKFNSETVNQWKTLYLLDEDTYTLTVYALDSKDPNKVTADFYMSGTYTLDGTTLEFQVPPMLAGTIAISDVVLNAELTEFTATITLNGEPLSLTFTKAE